MGPQLEPGSASNSLCVGDSRPIQRSNSGPSSFPTGPCDRPNSMAGYRTTDPRRIQMSRSAEFTSPGSDRDKDAHDSHDLTIITGGRGRESLLDNLLLSFDKIGDFTASPFFSHIDEVDDNESVYSQGKESRRSASVFEPDGGPWPVDVNHYDGGRFGLSYENIHEQRHGDREEIDGYASRENFESAPAPSIRTRNHTPSPRSLVRPPSIKSVKSSKGRDQPLSPHSEPVALPPLPAFANLPSPTMATPPKSNGRPGFFRRVFGGGVTSGSSNATSTAVKSGVVTAGPAPGIPPPSEPPHPVITKKASFFRRRKKSLSDNAPPIPAPIPVPKPSNVDATTTASPVTSLRNAMEPYVRSPVGSGNQESAAEDREHSYLMRHATIRTVASSDPISPRRPSFFAESSRSRDMGPQPCDKGDGSGKKYQKELWTGRSAESREERIPERSQKSRNIERPLTSPHSPPGRSFFIDEDTDVPQSPSPLRGILSSPRCTDDDKPRKSSAASRKNTVVEVTGFEETHADLKGKQKASVAPLALDTRNLGLPNSKQRSRSTSPIPGTPTVTLQKDGADEAAEVLDHDDAASSRIGDGELTDEDREMARKLFEGDEEFVSTSKAAAWLGDVGHNRMAVRKAYMELFNWSGVNILGALRSFCESIVFKGESQQVDRIILALSHRWCQCNPNHGFKSADVVHTILYSLLLLNTDLHMADLNSSQRMSRGQFIKNTMATIRRGLQETAAFEDLPARSPTPFRRNTDEELPTQSMTASPITEQRLHRNRPSTEFGREHKGSRLSRIGGLGSLGPWTDEQTDRDFDLDGSIALVNGPVRGVRLWETQVEVVLKDIYLSVKGSALPLHGLSQEIDSPHLSAVGTNQGLRRSPSNISKAASEMSATRSRDNTRLGAKWTAKNRSRQRLYNGSFAGSSRTSLEDRMWSPSASSTWSKYTLDKTQTSMSVDSLGSAFSHAAEYQQSIGFASALSNAIIREECASASSVEAGSLDLLEGDDELELAGAPWAKEGLLKHKHHMESAAKKSKNRAWTECFAVIQQGHLRLFQFPSKAAKNPQFGGVVGGGNWTENAEPIGSFALRQSIASALPPPGYSKAKPNVWALTLPSGACHFFQVGTTDIVKEFVSTANYWAARLSKEPLTGGVSNIEYGWGEFLADVDISSMSPPSSGHGESPRQHGRSSLQMSIRSSLDHGVTRPKLPGDKVHIMDWSPPGQSIATSNLKEQDQLKALTNYVSNVEEELKKHNRLRPVIQLAFTPRHPNAQKAMANWEKKSAYLLGEIVKFSTYIDTLRYAIDARRKYKEEVAARHSGMSKGEPQNVENNDVPLDY